MKSKKRNYRQYCGIAKALDAVGERWTLLIVRDLLLGPRRYGDLLANLPGITTNLLAQRLKDLAAAGLLERSRQPPPLRTAAYMLTPAGRELEPALLALGRWGWRYMERPRKGDRTYLGWALIALKRRYRKVARPLTVELAAGELRFQYRLTPDYADAREGAPWIADVSGTARMEDWRALFFGEQSSTQLQAGGKLTVSGDTQDWTRFLEAFELAL